MRGVRNLGGCGGLSNDEQKGQFAVRKERETLPEAIKRYPKSTDPFQKGRGDGIKPPASWKILGAAKFVKVG